jgi:hypothetical protein
MSSGLGFAVRQAECTDPQVKSWALFSGLRDAERVTNASRRNVNEVRTRHTDHHRARARARAAHRPLPFLPLVHIWLTPTHVECTVHGSSRVHSATDTVNGVCTRRAVGQDVPGWSDRPEVRWQSM